MSTADLLRRWTGINHLNLSTEMTAFLEADIFTRICEGLKEIFKIQYKDYFRLMKFNKEIEDSTMEINYVRCVINDILSTEEYSLPGIAFYTHKPEDVILDIATGINTDPSSSLLRKIIALHRSVRPDLYREIIKKIFTETLESESKQEVDAP